MPASTNRNVRQADLVPRPGERRDDGSSDGNDGNDGRTLRRGLALLDAVLDADSDGLRAVDLCRHSGLGRPTVHRLLDTLVADGWLARQQRFRYVVGPRLQRRLGSPPQPNLAMRLQPLLARISAACGDAAFAVVREGGLSQCIARQVGTHPVQVLVIQVGTQQPLGVGAAGLALLAALPDDEVAAVIAGNEPVLGRYGGMTPARLRGLVRSTRERGWSVIGNHATSGVLAVGMAVPDAQGRPVAGISVASTQLRMTRERQHAIAQLMRDTLKRHAPRARVVARNVAR